MLKETLIQTLRIKGLVLPTRPLINITGERFIAPFYHAVSDEPLPHIKNLYKTRMVKQFEADIDFLLRHYKPITLKELKQLTDEAELREKRQMFLSFDDGLRECYDVIAPILERKGVPATFFLNTAFLDNRGLMFRYKASLLIEALKSATEAQVAEVQQKLQQIGIHEKKVHKALLEVDYTQSSVLDEIAEILSVDFDEFLQKQRPYMTKTEVRDLMSRGFDVGSHSLDHPQYGKIPFEEQWRQTEKSLQTLADEFDPPIKSFAFPFTDDGVSEKFMRLLHEELVRLSFGGAGIKHDPEERHIQRFAMEGSDFTAKALVNAEYLYFIMKQPFGKNKIQRS